MPTQRATKIGGDWVESVDPNTGKKYYANLKTKQTQWTYPEDLKSAAHAGNDPNAWVERQDPKTGRTYYFSPVTRETRWEKPDNAVTAGSEVTTDDAANVEWKERMDPKSGRLYYYNPITKATSWTKPGASPTAAAAKATKKESPKKSRAKSLMGKKGSDEKQTRRLPEPPIPINKLESRKSVRLGLDGSPVNAWADQDATPKVDKKPAPMVPKREVVADDGDDGDAGTADGAGGDGSKEDKFAKLRAMKRAHDKPDILKPEENENSVSTASISIPAPTTEPPKKQQIAYVDPTIDMEKLNEEARETNAPRYEMQEYAKQFFNMKRKGFMSKLTTFDKILNWKAEHIKTSLHTIADPSMVADAVAMFKHLQAFMDLKHTRKDVAHHVVKFIKLTVSAPEELRDEAYCQVIKQTSNNPKEESCVRGWMVMVMCCGTYPPSIKLEKYLLSYIWEHTLQNPGLFASVIPYAEYCLVRLKKILVQGARREPVREEECMSGFDRMPVVVTVSMLDGTFKTVLNESWTTVQELADMIAFKFEIQDPAPFKIFEVGDNDEERILDEEDRVFDILSFWEREQTSSKNKTTFKFVYKMRLFFDIPEDDIPAIQLCYVQAVHDVVDSRYPCSEKDCITLAALQAQVSFGDYVPGENPFSGALSHYLPTKYCKSDDASLETLIIDVYKNLSGYSTIEAKLNYLDYVKSWKIYGSTYFIVQPQNSRDFPAECVMAINAKGILIVDLKTKAFLADYPYSEVVTWGHSALTFVVVVGNLIRQTKMYFKTDQGVEINAMVHSYVNRLLEH